MSLQKRVNPRYRVNHLEDLSAQIDKNCPRERLLTFSRQGCGFVGWENNPRLSIEEKEEEIAGRRVFTVLRIGGGQEIEVQGHLLYKRRVEVSGEFIYFYGIRFIDAHLDKLEPVLEMVEKKHEEGVVQTC
jgi:hypothetical protein